MKILLAAFACNPEQGSEPAVGWNWLKELSKENEVWVLFYDSELPALERGVEKLAHKNNIHLCPVGVPGFLRKRFYMQRYEVWNFLAYRLAKKLCKKVQFSVVHQLTIGAFWNCGYLWRLPIPFVFGPMSGDLSTPQALHPFVRPVVRLKQRIRPLSIGLVWHLWPRSRNAIRKAALVIAATPATKKRVEALRKGRPTALMCAGGISAHSFPRVSAAQLKDSQLRMIFSGRLISRKNLGLLLAALRQLPAHVDWRLRVVGDGPERSHWESVARESAYADRIEFLGTVPHSEMLQLYNWANTFVFPSSRDSNATVVMEAMAYGLPIVSLRIPGNELLLDDKTALMVDIETPNQILRDFAGALEMLSANPSLRERLGAAARTKLIGELGWDRRMQSLYQWYRAILQEHAL